MKLPALPTSPGVAEPAAVPSPVAPMAPAAALAPAEPPASGAGTDHEALRQLADKLSQAIGTTGQQVHFSVDSDTHQTVLRVTDAESGAVLRQIPGDEALSMARILDRMQGILIRQKA